MANCGPNGGVRVAQVRRGGLAAEAGLLPGDVVVAVNGRPLRDLIDFHLLAGDERLEIGLRRGEAAFTVALERRWGKALGLELAPPVPGEISTCSNKCIFCFIHQLPRGMRRSLYVKDDDYRLSFLHGNYITLTDLAEAELERIAAQRLSPLYISVHATDPALRHVLLGSPRTIKGDLLERMARLARAGIRMHTQIVLCPGINDGPHLERTVRDLARLHPAVATVAVVPVGLTRFRERLPALRTVTAEEARALLAAIHGWQAECLGTLGTRLVFAADELYLLAGEPLPPARAYEGYAVLEDGIGLVRRFEDGFRRLLRRLPRQVEPPRAVSVATGELFAPRLVRLLEAVRVRGLGLQVLAVPNAFFGGNISVAGLLTGQDIVRTLAGRPLGDLLLVPDAALKDGAGVFLDDLTLADLEAHLGLPVRAPEATARGLLRAALRSGVAEPSPR
ncbi:MAG: DUF512 domain-containing protein [Candidatus Rokubacteria bacterium]|nr:DUF512 domain-containing protein [Candidatus Rokubacteria bacterium]MBI2879222.1 DUF512 domain-containing protein [Candidatus Rokubacteria bacterium]